MSITFTTTLGGPELNMANGNAADLMKLLGLPVEAWGEAPAEDLLGRILLTQALLDVATDDERGKPTVTDGRWTDWGRPPGYMAGRLAELQEVATWAHHHHVDVIWD
ncbi:hypothetical protein [Spirillospora sp. CA-294931]|uniref:hypothetical protein n=1 Tax=Spirillospora sp. CA-294931 TaxID=3240042 RepID=UPI003D8A92A9